MERRPGQFLNRLSRAWGRLIGDPERLRPQLLLDLQRLQDGGFLREVGVDQGAQARVQAVDLVAVEGDLRVQVVRIRAGLVQLVVQGGLGGIETGARRQRRYRDRLGSAGRDRARNCRRRPPSG